MARLIDTYRQAILRDVEPTHTDLVIERDGELSCHYAPFEHMNQDAKVVLLGITPGAQQARNALAALRHALVEGRSDAEALGMAKATASFSGPLRNNLVALLDRIGLHDRLGLASSAQLFAESTNLVHFTSSLRNPVFVNGQDYSGSPSILPTPLLKRLMERWLVEEAHALHDAYWLPLGTEPTAVAQWLVEQGHLDARRVMAGLPHPSPSNSERIAYFLGKKPRELLSSRTNADSLDRNRERLTALVRGLAPAKAAEPVVTASVVPAAQFVEAPVKPVAPRPTAVRASKAGAAAVAQAEAILAARFEAIAPPKDKMAGFRTARGRHVAIERDLQTITLWTEDLTTPMNLGSPERYAATRGRHSGLKSHAPRLDMGKAVLKWRLKDAEAVEALLAWYSAV